MADLLSFKEWLKLEEKSVGEFFKLEIKDSKDKKKAIDIMKKLNIKFKEVDKGDDVFINPLVDVSSILGDDLRVALKKAKIDF